MNCEYEHESVAIKYRFNLKRLTITKIKINIWCIEVYNWSGKQWRLDLESLKHFGWQCTWSLSVLQYLVHCLRLVMRPVYPSTRNAVRNHVVYCNIAPGFTINAKIAKAYARHHHTTTIVAYAWMSVKVRGNRSRQQTFNALLVFMCHALVCIENMFIFW